MTNEEQLLRGGIGNQPAPHFQARRVRALDKPRLQLCIIQLRLVVKEEQCFVEIGSFQHTNCLLSDGSTCAGS